MAARRCGRAAPRQTKEPGPPETDRLATRARSLLHGLRLDVEDAQLLGHGHHLGVLLHGGHELLAVAAPAALDPTVSPPEVELCRVAPAVDPRKPCDRRRRRLARSG